MLRAHPEVPLGGFGQENLRRRQFAVFLQQSESKDSERCRVQLGHAHPADQFLSCLVVDSVGPAHLRGVDSESCVSHLRQCLQPLVERFLRVKGVTGLIGLHLYDVFGVVARRQIHKMVHLSRHCDSHCYQNGAEHPLKHDEHLA